MRFFFIRKHCNFHDKLPSILGEAEYLHSNLFKGTDSQDRNTTSDNLPR